MTRTHVAIVRKLPTAEAPPRHRRQSGLSPVTFLLVFAPAVLLFLALGFFALALVVAAGGLVLALLARRSVRRRVDRMVLVFAMIGAGLVLFIILPMANLLATTDPAEIVATAADPDVQVVLGRTLLAALEAALISLLIGVPLGYVLARERFAGKPLVESIVDLPLVIPHTVSGVALLFVFGRSGILGGPMDQLGFALVDTEAGIVFAMLFVSVPFVVNHARDGFRKVDPRLEHMARILGAGRFGAFARVTLPLSWRPLLTGAVLTWALAISEFGTIAIIAYYPRTVNTLLFEWFNSFGYRKTQALASLLLLIALAIFITVRALAATRREHERGTD